MQTTSDHPPAAADDAADRRPIDSPEDEATQDERIKRSPSDTELFLALAPEVQALFGPPPLILGEDAQAYETLLLAIAQAVEPKDVIEWFYVKDIADSTWAEQRLRRLQTRLLCKEIQSGLREHLQSAFRAAGKTNAESEKLAAEAATAFITNDQKKIAATNKALLEPVDLVSVTAKALVKILDVYGTLDRMITTASVRRQAVSREIDRRREAAARRFRLKRALLVPSRAFAGAGRVLR
jgi:hypothetical protein